MNASFAAPLNWREQTAEVKLIMSSPPSVSLLHLLIRSIICIRYLQQRDYQARWWRVASAPERASHLRKLEESAAEDSKKYAILDACRVGHEDKLCALLDEHEHLGATFHAPGSDRVALLSDRTTPLHVAVVNSQHAVALALIKRGGDANQKDADNLTPLLIACGLGDRNMTELLLSQGRANIESKGPFQRTPLHRAVIGGHVNVVRLLLQKRADAEAEDTFGENAVTLARTWAARCRDRHGPDFSVEKESDYQSCIDLLSGVADFQAAAKGMLLAKSLAHKMAGRAAAARMRRRAQQDPQVTGS